MSSAPASIPGWHGKLPSLGDFASRRLPAGFVEPWDGWLSAGLTRLRQADPAGWLDAYLAAPSTRFVLMPGVMPGVMPDMLPSQVPAVVPAMVPAGAAAPGAQPVGQAWAGVLMPSVDRVGRYFPLTLAWPLPALPASAEQLRALWSWLGRLDDLAADALQDDWGVDRLESELAALARPELLPRPTGAGRWPALAGSLLTQPLLPPGDIVSQLNDEALALWTERAMGLAYWYTCTGHQTPRLRVSRGLPDTAAGLLGGAA